MARLTILEDLLNRMFRDVEQAGMEAEERAAKADPLRHKLSRTMERGKRLSYRYAGTVTPTRGRTVRYCWTCNRNVAGFYVGWRETETDKTVKRDQWTARRVKARLAELQTRRTKAHRARLTKPR